MTAFRYWSSTPFRHARSQSAAKAAGIRTAPPRAARKKLRMRSILLMLVDYLIAVGDFEKRGVGLRVFEVGQCSSGVGHKRAGTLHHYRRSQLRRDPRFIHRGCGFVVAAHGTARIGKGGSGPESDNAIDRLRSQRFAEGYDSAGQFC